MSKEIDRSYKYDQPKLSTQTINNPVLSSSAAHTSSASNSTRTSTLSQHDNKDITKNQNKNNTSNTYDIHSCVTPQKQNYSVNATSTTTRLTALDTSSHISPVELHKKKITPAGKEYLNFKITGISSHAAQCVKSRITNKAIDYILYIDKFEQMFFDQSYVTINTS